MPNEIAEVTLYDDGKIVVVKKITFDGEPAETIVHDQQVGRRIQTIHDISFLDGVAQVLSHFTGTRWLLTWSSGRCPRITISRTDEVLKRRGAVVFSDLVFIVDLWVVGHSVRCDYTGECNHRTDTFPYPRWPKNRRGYKKWTRKQLSQTHIQQGAKWACQFLVGHFMTNTIL